jgi:hypothetical protein
MNEKFSLKKKILKIYQPLGKRLIYKNKKME